MRRHLLVLLLQRQDAPRVGQRMNDDRGVLPRLDDLVDVADRAATNCECQRPVVPNRLAGHQQEAAHEVGRRHVLVRRHRDQRPVEPPCHIFEKPGFAAAGRSLQHDRQAMAVSGFEYLHLIADRPIVRFDSNTE